MRLPAVLPTLFLLLGVGSGAVHAAVAHSAVELRFQEPLSTALPLQSPRLLSYVIDAKLAEDGHTISAQLQVTWRNTTSVPTGELFWHVYNNAWADRDSAWLTESRRLGDMQEPTEWGGTVVSHVRLASGQPLSWEYLPQPGAPLDRTVARIVLPEVVPPGGSVAVSLDFSAVLPRAFRRSGWGNDGYLHAAQWFPKLGVFENLDGKMQWNCPPYRYLAEFYADFANFQVAITLPASYAGKFVATGSILGNAPVTNPDATVTYFTSAEDVHDFAWTADPQATLIEREFRAELYRNDGEEERVAAALGRTLEEVRPTPTRMVLLLQPEHASLAERYFDALGKSIYYFGLWYGSYPYPTISVVDPAHDARGTGGMEYPRLITGGASLGVAARTLQPQGVTVHEFGHQFWYGLVGNDEFRHAWLDEGFNTFSTQRVKALAFEPQLDTYSVFGHQYYGRAPMQQPTFGAGDFRAMLGLQRWETPDVRSIPALSYELRHRESLQDFLAELPPLTYFPRITQDAVLSERQKFANPWQQPLEHPTMDLVDGGLRRVNAYYRPALTLETMARLMGEPNWTRVMRAYHERWRFRHPSPTSFLETVLEFGGKTVVHGANGEVPVDWNLFWQQAYHGNDRLDYSVHHLRNELLPATGNGEQSTPHFNVSVGIARRSDFGVPVEVRVTWQDGSATDLVWAGDDWVWEYSWPNAEQRAVMVEIDPRRRLLLDGDWLNNVQVVEPSHERSLDYAVQVMLWAQQVLFYYGGAG
jgi:hypothetical protein